MYVTPQWLLSLGKLPVNHDMLLSLDPNTYNG